MSTEPSTIITSQHADSIDAERSPVASLRFRFLGPIVLATLLVTIAISMAAYRFGSRQAQLESDQRFDDLQRTISQANYPFNDNVLRLLSSLTDAELVTLDANDEMIRGTIDSLDEAPRDRSTVVVDRIPYLVRRIPIEGASRRSDGVRQVAVLLDQTQLAQRKRRLIVLPLATGLLTVIPIGLISYLTASRLIRRIRRLQQQVHTIAGGNWKLTIDDTDRDELSRLAHSINQMASELETLWKQAERRQGEKLIAQVAAGMAHQLRNSLTGARMAIELHAREHDDRNDEGITVALDQIEKAEDYVRRIVMLASGRLADAVEMPVAECLRRIRETIGPIASHLRKPLDWNVSPEIEGATVAEGSTFVAGVSNLIQNALQAGQTINIAADRDGETLTVAVVDDGPGVDEAIASEMFEPFVTTKSEGLGLGLSVATRAATTLGGRVEYLRNNHTTEFRFTCNIKS
ncbi:HAMP domain-containing sensor histidine kinase [Roseiconus lacunae]|uniref:sensor histidine kinase n=1 Tax=Roseiconus lacunae TaxID=2605694 RepID=UPI00308DDC78|nr:HAMP domain-containing sensor histidine kinase [Stieleria sp. HD01]